MMLKVKRVYIINNIKIYMKKKKIVFSYYLYKHVGLLKSYYIDKVDDYYIFLHLS